MCEVVFNLRIIEVYINILYFNFLLTHIQFAETHIYSCICDV